MSDEAALFRAILDELKAIHALVARLGRRRGSAEETVAGAGAVEDKRRALAGRLERAHRVRPSEG